MGANEMRVSLTFEYVTNPNMRAWRRFVSNMKDAIAYFGFKQVFRQLRQRRAGRDAAGGTGGGTPGSRTDGAGGTL